MSNVKTFELCDRTTHAPVLRLNNAHEAGLYYELLDGAFYVRRDDDCPLDEAEQRAFDDGRSLV